MTLTSPSGASLPPALGEARLDLGELQQVLQDEELARKLQEEEEKLLRRVRDVLTTLNDLSSHEEKKRPIFPLTFTIWYSQKSPPSPSCIYPEGDFRVAQVAQDEVPW